MKRVVSFLFIFVFGCLLLPKDLLHDCEHHHHLLNHNDEGHHELHFDSEECFVCGLEFFQEYKPVKIVEFRLTHSVVQSKVRVCNNCIKKNLRVPDSRGSPLEIS